MSHAEISSESLFERYAPLFDRPRKAEMRRWAVLSVIALGIAGVMGMMLPTMIAMGSSSQELAFRKVLTIHVVFSFVVFFLCVFALIQHAACVRFAGGVPKSEWMGYAAYRGVFVSFIFLAVPALLPETLGLTDPHGNPVTVTLNNYVPVITNKMYYLALMVLAMSMVLIANRTIINFFGRDRSIKMDPLQTAAVAGAVAYLAAFVWGMIALFGLKADQAVIDHQYNEDLFWGAGHVLQFVNVAMLLASWYVLGKVAFGRNPSCPMATKMALLVVGGSALGSFALLGLEMFGGEQNQAFTDLQYLHIAPTVPVAGMIVWGIVKKGGAWGNPAFTALALSILVFGLGGIYGLFADGTDLRTPGHYHGIIAGLTVAFMGLFASFVLPLLGRDTVSDKIKNWMLTIFVLGQASAATGLFIAGSYGAERKTVGANRDILDPVGMFGLHMNQSGSLIAGIGGILFVWFVGKALMQKQKQEG